MIKTILYFTNKVRLTSTLGVGEIELNSYLNDDEVTHTKPIINNGYTIYMIKDNLSFQDFKKIWDSTLKDVGNFIFYYHTKPEDNKIVNFLNDKNNCKCSKKGSHQVNNNGYEYYQPLKDIIENDLTEDKFTALVNLCPSQLNETLDLLHKILNREIIDADSLPKELKKQFETHYNITKKYNDEYETQLVALRDAILEEKFAKAQ